jgi:hypothetical protein
VQEISHSTLQGLLEGLNGRRKTIVDESESAGSDTVSETFIVTILEPEPEP